jgi:hypothetical protein
LGYRAQQIMAIAPYYWQKARAEAPIHIQIRLEKRPDKASALVGGKVVQIFRDDLHRLRRGERIFFRVSCYEGGGGSDKRRDVAVPGRQSFALNIEWLKAARFLEAYLAPAWRDGREDENGSLELVWDQATALLRATAQPVNPADREGCGIFVTDDVLRRVGAGSPTSAWWSRIRQFSAGRKRGR